MKTNFTETQLADPQIAEADQILKSCQHFGFCTSGCPTYVLLHDENDGPRGRIDLIKEMLESNDAPSPTTVEHIDRCLSCMSCMTTCAVKVDYMHLVDTAREHIETRYRRPLGQRIVRNALGYVLPRPGLFRAALTLGRAAARFEAIVPKPLRPMLRLLPAAATRPPYRGTGTEVYPAVGARRWRVALLAGCVQPEMSPHINAATIRLLTRFGCEVVIPRAAGCCGSLNLHMGKTDAARTYAGANVEAWAAQLDADGLDAVLINASGCGTTVKDYGHLLKDDPVLAGPAKRIAEIAKDICEWLSEIQPPKPEKPRRHRVTYHDACSLRNAQKVTAQPRALLKQAGYLVTDVPEGHFCCGSAGTYNILQPKIAAELGERKAQHIASTSPQIVSAGNIGCIMQIGLYSGTPVLHTVELLDWAYGGPLPPALQGVEPAQAEQAAEPDAAAAAESGQPIHFYSNEDSKGAGANDVGVW